MRHLRATTFVFLAIAFATGGFAQKPGAAPQPQNSTATPTLPSPAQLSQWMRTVAEQQAEYLQRTGAHFRYRLHRVDAKEDTLRDVIESSSGSVTRLLQHNGQALIPAEDEGDRDRLAHYVISGDLRRKEREEKRNQGFGLEVMRAMPTAMLFTLTPGQPQLPQRDRPQFVLDFAPNPQFHPASAMESLLTGLSGRLWLDSADHHLVRIEITTLRNLDLAMGILVRVFPGGTIEYDQRRIAEGVYAYSHIRMHLRLRELMVKTVPYDSDLVATDIEQLEPVPTAEQAVQTLLHDEVKTR